MNTLYQKVRR